MIKIKKHLRSKTDDGLNDYIEGLENYFLEMKASNTNRLLFKLDEVNGLLADDIDMIIKGEDWDEDPITFDEEVSEENKTVLHTGHSRLKILSDSKDSKVFDRLMALYTKLKDLKSVSDYVGNLIPQVEDPKEEAEITIVPTKGKNPYEDILKQMQEGGKK